MFGFRVHRKWGKEKRGWEANAEATRREARAELGNQGRSSGTKFRSQRGQ